MQHELWAPSAPRITLTGKSESILRVVGTELGVANLLQRHFDWVANSLWYEEIPNAHDPSKTLFLLGGKDNIVHSEVRKNQVLVDVFS